MHFPRIRKQRSREPADAGYPHFADRAPNTVVSGIVEAIGHYTKLEVATPVDVNEILPSLNNALKTHYVIKLKGSGEIHTLQSERWMEVLALTGKGDRIAFVISAVGAQRILSFDNLTLWPEPRQRAALDAGAAR